jgi:hypothetical protein
LTICYEDETYSGRDLTEKEQQVMNRLGEKELKELDRK